MDLFDGDAVVLDGAAHAGAQLAVGKVQAPVGVLVVEASDEAALAAQARILTPRQKLAVKHRIHLIQHEIYRSSHHQRRQRRLTIGKTR